MNKVCECGCGKETTINWKHQHNRFINGHNKRNTPTHGSRKKKTEDFKHKMSIIQKSSFVRNKVIQTFKTKYGFTHPMNHPEISKNRKETNIKSGRWIDDIYKTQFDIYIRKVLFFTYRSLQKKYTKEELNKRKISGIENGFHIDHKFSIKEGFIHNILPCIIGSCCNLELISWKDNIKKDSNCSITKEELFNLYDQEIK